MSGIYHTEGEGYRKAGYWPRPIKPGTKGCHVKGWQQSDDDIAPSVLRSWSEQYGNHGIGLLMGSPFPDGTKLAALDIDRDDRKRLAAALLCQPPSGRIGARGIVYFARVRGPAPFRKFTLKRRGGAEPVPIGELLGDQRLCVVPPTIHPTTGRPYHWVGQPLLQVHYEDLPLIEMLR